MLCRLKTYLFYLNADDSPCGSRVQEPVVSLRLHASVLAGTSPGHLKPHILRLWRKNAQPVDPFKAATRVLELTCFPGEPHDVLEAVMRHAYTSCLPEEPALLAWVRCVGKHTSNVRLEQHGFKHCIRWLYTRTQ